MEISEQELSQKICDDVTQIEVDLETALKEILEQAGSKIKPEKQEEIKKEMEGTKQVLERFKSRYG
ncbi:MULTISPECIES: hypothetical protein [Nostocales]|uniref:Uncharacterized protein n=3 Tax=Nostocales TaxID=1161 RepID=A0A0C1QNZ2_9CYAN|nr:hypothetical protein [Tolypothrix bouteillei]KAF3889325.1 hypothetical protein DA73_0400030465 [Tolypothrix bouteillei VB521301]